MWKVENILIVVTRESLAYYFYCCPMSLFNVKYIVITLVLIQIRLSQMWVLEDSNVYKTTV